MIGRNKGLVECRREESGAEGGSFMGLVFDLVGPEEMVGLR